MRNRHIPAWIFLGLALGACEDASQVSSLPDTDPEAAPSVITPLNREITALKARESDPEKVEAALREILPRYGYPLPTVPAIPGIAREPVTSAEPSEELAEVTTDIWSTVKDTTFSWESRSGMSTFIVPAGGSFDVWTNASGAADPALVAFYRNGGTSTSTVIGTGIIAVNDDRGDGTQNARIRWTNNLGVSREVYIVVYAYTFSGRGTTALTLRLPDGTTETSQNVPAYATPLYNNNVSVPPLGGCTGANASRIQLTRIDGGGFGSGALAVNLTTMRGGLIKEKSGVTTQTALLNDVLPSGGGSFLMGFVYGHPSPLFGTNVFSALQQNRQTCLVPIF